MDFKNNKTDYGVILAKTVLGSIPVYGSVVSEIVTNIVPNQRLDRIAKYLKELDEKLSSIPLEKINKLFQNEGFIDLIEESLYMSSRLMSDERRSYIINIIFNGIDYKEIEIIQSKQLLKIINDLNDIEIIWLRYYSIDSYDNKLEFKKQNKRIFEIDDIYNDINEKEFIDKVIKENYLEHLERLGLITRVVDIDQKKEMPKFDNVTGTPKTKYHRATSLGKLLLKQIGVAEDIIFYKKREPNDIR